MFAISWFLLLFHDLTSDTIRYYVLAKLLCYFEVYFFIECWLKQTGCVCYFMNICVDCFVILTVHKSDTLCYLSYWIDCGYIWSLERYSFKHTMLAVSMKWIVCFFRDLTIEKSDTLCVVYFNLLIWCLFGHWKMIS